jgi:hypothetical protein
MLVLFKTYVKQIEGLLNIFDWESVHQLALTLKQAWEMVVGAGKASHLANYFNYGIDK